MRLQPEMREEEEGGGEQEEEEEEERQNEEEAANDERMKANCKKTHCLSTGDDEDPEKFDAAEDEVDEGVDEEDADAWRGPGRIRNGPGPGVRCRWHYEYLEIAMITTTTTMTRTTPKLSLIRSMAIIL